MENKNSAETEEILKTLSAKKLTSSGVKLRPVLVHKLEFYFSRRKKETYKSNINNFASLNKFSAHVDFLQTIYNVGTNLSHSYVTRVNTFYSVV